MIATDFKGTLMEAAGDRKLSSHYRASALCAITRQKLRMLGAYDVFLPKSKIFEGKFH